MKPKDLSWRSPRSNDIVAVAKKYKYPIKISDIYKHVDAQKPEHESIVNEIVDRLVIEGKFKYVRDHRVALSSFLSPIQEYVVAKITPDNVILAQSWDDPEGTDYYKVKAPPAIHGKIENGSHFIGKLEDKPFQKHKTFIKFIRFVEAQERKTVGVLEFHPITHQARLKPLQKGEYPFSIDNRLVEHLAEGDLVVFYHGTKPSIERIGNLNDPKSMAMIAIYEHRIPYVFPELARVECENLPQLNMEHRLDLRQMSLITIDGEDAKDFDDAVFAEKCDGGWRVVVAIADVSYYVPVGSALDREAYKRGNSAYFPGFVVPMLPEALSNGICSLMPNVDRACMVADMVINLEGKIIGQQFYRAVMCSKARTTYNEIEEIISQASSKSSQHPLKDVVANLYEAFKVLQDARKRRGTLDLNIEERQVIFDGAGAICEVKARERLESHQLIEEFMILANVAVASFLEENQQALLFRVHDSPQSKKLEEFEKSLKPFYNGAVKSSKKFFSHILEQFNQTPLKDTINELVLRTQSQAVYSPYNIGHFGLSLKRYCHFTSPIRRYADLLIHRALGVVLGIDSGPLSLYDSEAVGLHISTTERRAATAERETMDRLVATYMETKMAQNFKARVVGIHRAGIFVRTMDEHVDGLIPFRNMGDDHYVIDEETNQIIGARSRTIFALGDMVEVSIHRLDPLAGHVDFNLLDHTPQFTLKNDDKRGAGDKRSSDKRDRKGSDDRWGRKRSDGGQHRSFSKGHDDNRRQFDRKRRDEDGEGRDREDRPFRGRGGGGRDREDRPFRGRGGEGRDREDRPFRGRSGEGRDREDRPFRGRGGEGREDRPARGRTWAEREEMPARGKRSPTRREGIDGESGSSFSKGRDNDRRQFDRKKREDGRGDREDRPFRGRGGEGREDRPRSKDRLKGDKPSFRKKDAVDQKADRKRKRDQ